MNIDVSPGLISYSHGRPHVYIRLWSVPSARTNGWLAVQHDDKVLQLSSQLPTTVASLYERQIHDHQHNELLQEQEPFDWPAACHTCSRPPLNSAGLRLAPPREVSTRAPGKTVCTLVLSCRALTIACHTAHFLVVLSSSPHNISG
jgi:hypothetical protein